MTNSRSKGAALLIFMLFFTIASAGVLFSITRTIYSDLVVYRMLFESKQSYHLADTFTEDAVYRFRNGMRPDDEETIFLFDAYATTTIDQAPVGSYYDIVTTATHNEQYRTVALELSLGAGASFNFGVQTGNGGFVMTNNSVVNGNLFSNGTIVAQNGAEVNGDVISAGPNGYVQGIHASGSVWAHEIKGQIIKKNAYYQVIDLSGTTVHGDLYPNWPDEATTTLPIPDDTVEQFKASTTEAIANGEGQHILATDPECSSGTYVIDTTMTLSGPTIVDCNMSVNKRSTTLTLTDTLWVKGDLSFAQGPTLSADPATATDSILVIVDNENNRETSSKIEIVTGTVFVAANSPKSYIVLLSMNSSAENGGSEVAISMGQSSEGDVLLYAGHGLVELENHISLKEVTGYRITMGNQTTIDYESGLVNLNFTSGPGGGFEVSNWQEI